MVTAASTSLHVNNNTINNTASKLDDEEEDYSLLPSDIIEYNVDIAGYLSTASTMAGGGAGSNDIFDLFMSNSGGKARTNQFYSDRTNNQNTRFV